MPFPDSVTDWIGQLKAGDHVAAQRLWERYFPRLVGLARKKLHGMPRSAADEEDVALSAFNSFCQAAEQGQLPQLRDRDSLWPLLVVITARKAYNLRRYEQRQKRGGGMTQHPVALGREAAGEEVLTFEQILGREPTPEFALQVAEEYERLLARLEDPALQAIAVWKMEGCTNQEIAAKLGCAFRAVERRLRVIRSIWAQESRP